MKQLTRNIWFTILSLLLVLVWTSGHGQAWLRPSTGGDTGGATNGIPKLNGGGTNTALHNVNIISAAASFPGDVTGNAATATTATTATNANFAATYTDPDASAYLTFVGKTNSQHRDRVISSIVTLKNAGLWDNLVDAAVLGTNLNLAGNYWGTLKLRYGTNANGGVMQDYGLRFYGTNYAYVRDLPDMRTSTIIVVYQGTTLATNAIIAAQNSATSNSSIAVMAYPYVGAPTYDARDIDVFHGGNISAGQVTSNAIPFWTGPGLSAFTDEEHTIAVASDSTGKRSVWVEGWNDESPSTIWTNTPWTMTNTITSLNLGAFLAGDANAPASGAFSGVVKAFAVFDKMLTTNEVSEAAAALRCLDVRPESAIFVGDSLTSYYDLPSESGTFFTNTYPWQYMNSVGISNRYYWRNLGQGSTFTFDWVTFYNDRVRQHRPREGVSKARILYRLGANDLLYGTALGADYINGAINAVSNFCRLASADGFTVEVLTVTPITNSFGGQLSNDTPRLVFNRALETNANWFTKLWKVDELFPNMNTNSLYSTDGTHPTYRHNRALADYLASGGTAMTTTGILANVRGTIKAEQFTGSGANLTALAASELTGVIPASVVSNSVAAAGTLNISTANVTNLSVINGATVGQNVAVGGNVIGLGTGLTNADGFHFAATNESKAVTMTNAANQFAGTFTNANSAGSRVQMTGPNKRLGDVAATGTQIVRANGDPVTIGSGLSDDGTTLSATGGSSAFTWYSNAYTIVPAAAEAIATSAATFTPTSNRVYGYTFYMNKNQAVTNFVWNHTTGGVGAKLGVGIYTWPGHQRILAADAIDCDNGLIGIRTNAFSTGAILTNGFYELRFAANTNIIAGRVVNSYANGFAAIMETDLLNYFVGAGADGATLSNSYSGTPTAVTTLGIPIIILKP